MDERSVTGERPLRGTARMEWQKGELRAMTTSTGASGREDSDSATKRLGLIGMRLYNCDCLNAAPDGSPSDDPDAIYCQRWVVLAEDVAARVAALTEALRAWQTRLAFVGHPKEPPDWSRPVQLTDAALREAPADEEST